MISAAERMEIVRRRIQFDTIGKLRRGLYSVHSVEEPRDTRAEEAERRADFPRTSHVGGCEGKNA
jgi:hypothetical protein